MKMTRRTFMGSAVSAATLASMPFESFAAGRKILIMASSVDIPNFDPHVATGYAPAMLFRNTYDALVRVVGTPPEIKPGPAASWTVSEDKKHAAVTAAARK